MAFQNLDTGSLDVFSAVAGSSLNIPKGFWKPGTAAIYNGYLGTTALSQYGQGTCNVGMSPDSPYAYTGAVGNVNFHNKCLTQYDGDHRVVGRSSVQGIEFRTNVANSHIVANNFTIAASKASISSPNLDLSSKNLNIKGKVSITGLDAATGTRPQDWDKKKPFDILHPTKEGHRLRYVCLEGPKAEVYVRGKSKNNVIELPDYWVGLVDEESITVHLTPVGFNQNLYVESICDNKITIAGAEKYNFQYVAYGERKDTEPNIPEYKGLTEADYPGDNREYTINND